MNPNEQQNSQTSEPPKVINPVDQLFAPSVSAAPPDQVTSPQPSSLPNNLSNSGSKKTKKLLIVALALIIIFAVVVVITLVFSADKKDNQQQNQQAEQPTLIIKEPTAIDVENVSNSISSDITGLDDDNDFPENNLADKDLGL